MLSEKLHFSNPEEESRNSKLATMIGNTNKAIRDRKSNKRQNPYQKLCLRKHWIPIFKDSEMLVFNTLQFGIKHIPFVSLVAEK